ncbi:hypothetical protein QTG54_016322 [Skeletonema marinoi]|uniref:Uncharacterized protein n=1 Tax=Skeletonema marinoi TaxID=267567 RepID=A0AAD8XTB7_9STRA|nr:hypothetical protein QTG54_016322 [Skeletonema marinoi]
MHTITMKVDPIKLDRGINRGETISKNVEQVHNKRGFKSMTPWKRRGKNHVGINRSKEPVTAAPAPAVTNNASKSILRVVVIDQNELNENRSVISDAARKKVRWDPAVKERKKLSFGRLNKAVIDNLKGLAIGLDDSVQNVREKMQCGSMAVAKDYYCPRTPCGRCEVDGWSLGTNDIVDDDESGIVHLMGAHYQEESAVVEAQEENLGMLQGDAQRLVPREQNMKMVGGDLQWLESQETLTENTDDRYEELPAEDRENKVPTVKASATAAARQKKRGTLVCNDSTSNYYNRSAPVTFPTPNKAAMEWKGGKGVAKASQAKASTRILQPDKGYPTAKQDKKASKQSKRKKENRRYTTRDPRQRKKGLKGKLTEPIRMIAVGMKLHTRKMLTSNGHV